MDPNNFVGKTAQANSRKYAGGVKTLELKCGESQLSDEILGWVQGLTPPCTPAFISWPQEQLPPLARGDGQSSAGSALGPDLQSISSAWPSLPITDMNWSMIPQGMLANVCSAFWHSSALATKSLSSVPGQRDAG